MNSQPVFIISGEQGAGKTTHLNKVVSELQKRSIEVKGFIAPGLWVAGLRSEFYIQELSTGNQELLCKNDAEKGFERIGRFYFNPKTIAYGEKILHQSKPGDLLVIDEVGMFEIKGHVWRRVLKELMEDKENPLLITVRQQFLEDVSAYFNILDPIVFDVSEDSKGIADKILAFLDK